MTEAIQIGSYGERVAALFLRRQGYRVLTRNFAADEGEIDLICRDGDALVFVEVRTRAGVEFGQPVETIDARKRENLRDTARRYLELLKNDAIFYRFDAVEIILREGQIPVCTLQRDLFS